MTRFMRFMRLAWAGSLAISCGGSGSDDAGAVGELCIEGRCAAGLYCAPETAINVDLANRCTAACTEQTFCPAHFGPQATCFSRTFCARTCTSASDCQGGHCTMQANGE